MPSFIAPSLSSPSAPLRSANDASERPRPKNPPSRSGEPNWGYPSRGERSNNGRMPFAVGPGRVRIHYRVVGETGENVVLIQGLGLSSRFWFEQPELLVSEPKRPRRVLVLDNRGTGLSDK